jgi:hypothetical protein
MQVRKVPADQLDREVSFAFDNESEMLQRRGCFQSSMTRIRIDPFSFSFYYSI